MSRNTREYNRQYAIDRRQRQKQEGMCPLCSTQKVEPGMSACRACLDATNERMTNLYRERAKRNEPREDAGRE